MNCKLFFQDGISAKIQLNIYDFGILFDALGIVFSHSTGISLIESFFSGSRFIYDLFAHNFANIASNSGITCFSFILFEHKLAQLVVFPSLVLHTLISNLSVWVIRLILYT